MKKQFFVLAACAVAGLFVADMALAQGDLNSARSNRAGPPENDEKGEVALPGDPIPDIDITTRKGSATSDKRRKPSVEDPGQGTTETAQRKKMEILKPVDAGPLEPIDETDPCPTLPCQ